MILDPNGMPILQPAIDNAETATFNAAFAAIGDASQIKTFKWADAGARGSQSGMSAGDLGYQSDTKTYYTYSGSAWDVILDDSGWLSVSYAAGFSGSFQVRRVNGAVYCRGTILPTGSGTVSGSFTQLCTIPVGARPDSTENNWSGATTIQSLVNFQVTTSGSVGMRAFFITSGNYTTNTQICVSGGWRVS